MQPAIPDTRLPLLHYDSARRRLWLAGQRCHHGATGALMALAALGGLTLAHNRPRTVVTIAATGSLLMAHDWNDRTIWFERGWQDQP